LAVTPSGKGRGNGKKTYMGVGGAAREKGRRDEGWNEISYYFCLMKEVSGPGILFKRYYNKYIGIFYSLF
jgi:hypothetical protein